jgi:hypothetical protein
MLAGIAAGLLQNPKNRDLHGGPNDVFVRAHVLDDLDVRKHLPQLGTVPVNRANDAQIVQHRRTQTRGDPPHLFRGLSDKPYQTIEFVRLIACQTLSQVQFQRFDSEPYRAKALPDSVMQIRSYPSSFFFLSVEQHSREVFQIPWRI